MEIKLISPMYTGNSLIMVEYVCVFSNRRKKEKKRVHDKTLVKPDSPTCIGRDKVNKLRFYF